MPHSLISSAPNLACLFEHLEARAESPVLDAEGQPTTATALLVLTQETETRLIEQGIGGNSICAFEGDFSPQTVALMLALMRLGAVMVPFSRSAAAEREALCRISGVSAHIDASTLQVTHLPDANRCPHELVLGLRKFGHPGLVVFTSGSTGRPKAILHDVDRVAAKFAVPRRGWRMVLFLLIDHFGGFNTLMACLADGGVGICVPDRSPQGVCRAISLAKAELLPTTPTFLGLLIASGVWRDHDLSSVRLVTYGAEPMPPATLARLPTLFPHADFKQTYGLSELGVLRSSSPDPQSLWLKVGGPGFETKVVDGVLHVRSASTMLGYLNAPSPIDADGWMNTGDLIEEKDGLIRFLGRRSEIINVGGQKVFPTEVEGVLLEADNVAEALVEGAPHPLLGQAVIARIGLIAPEDGRAATERLRDHCRTRLQKYKVPMRFLFIDSTELLSERAKKRRVVASGDAGGRRT